MSPNITKALEHLQNAYYAGYFAEMNAGNIPAQFKNPFATLQNMYSSGQTLPHDFSQKLEVLAKQIGATSTDKSGIVDSQNVLKDVQVGNVGGNFIIGNQTAEKIININHADQVNIS